MTTIQAWKDPDEMRWYETPLGTLKSVTSYLKVLNKPALVNWAASTTAEYIRDKLSDIKAGLLDLANMDVTEIVAAARNHHKEKFEQAGQRGTNIHHAIDTYVKTGVIPTLDTEAPETVELFDSYIKWTKDLQVKPIESELTVYSKYDYAGTLDQVIWVQNAKVFGRGKQLWINDFKTGKAIYDEAGLQVAAYFYAFLEINPKYRRRLKGAMITRLYPGGYELKLFNKAQCEDLFSMFLCIVSYVTKMEKYKNQYGKRGDNGRNNC